VGYKLPGESESYANPIVIDNSVMMRWLFDDGSIADQQYAKAVLAALKDRQLTVLVPPIWVYESAFVTNHYVKQKSINRADSRQQLDMLFELVNVIYTQQTPVELLEVSQAVNISSYDAAYLLLAQQQECPLATLDKKMKKAHKKSAGVVFIP